MEVTGSKQLNLHARNRGRPIVKLCNSTWIHRALGSAVAGALFLGASAIAAHRPPNDANWKNSIASHSAKARARIPDAELAGKVRSALYATFGVGANEVAVAAQDGFISLYGEVRSDAVRIRAERIASRVPGVRAVDNKLEIDRDG